MPTEFRKVIFSTQELLTAVRLLQHRRGSPIKSEAISSFFIVDEPELAAVLVMSQEDGTRVRMTLNEPEIAAAMIVFCRDHSIPLPAHAQKELRRTEDGIALHILQKAQVPGAIRAA